MGGPGGHKSGRDGGLNCSWHGRCLYLRRRNRREWGVGAAAVKKQRMCHQNEISLFAVFVTASLFQNCQNHPHYFIMCEFYFLSILWNFLSYHSKFHGLKRSQLLLLFSSLIFQAYLLVIHSDLTVFPSLSLSLLSQCTNLFPSFLYLLCQPHCQYVILYILIHILMIAIIFITLLSKFGAI